jgi:aryl-alcohol dehydrogenase-like predicted oxidoreductase
VSVSSNNDGRYRRRDIIALGVAAAGALAARRLSAATPSSSVAPLISKPIPASGQMLPVIGLGGRDFRDHELADLRAVIGRMLELGGTIIDTAAAYGGGQSERVIGQVLSELGARPRVFLATKLTGTPQRGRYGRESFQRSLELLRTDYLDLLQVHNLVGVDAAWPLLTELKQSRKIRYLGITTSSPDDHGRMAQLMQRYPVDFVEVDYSIGNRDAAQTVLPVALEHKIAVMVDVPLGGAGRGGFALASVQGKPLPPLAAALEVRDWPQLLLKYAVSHPAVTCAIPGTTKVRHLEDDQAAGRGRLPDDAMRRELERYWDRVIARPGSA